MYYKFTKLADDYSTHLHTMVAETVDEALTVDGIGDDVKKEIGESFSGNCYSYVNYDPHATVKFKDTTIEEIIDEVNHRLALKSNQGKSTTFEYCIRFKAEPNRILHNAWEKKRSENQEDASVSSHRSGRSGRSRSHESRSSRRSSSRRSSQKSRGATNSKASGNSTIRTKKSSKSNSIAGPVPSVVVPKKPPRPKAPRVVTPPKKSKKSKAVTYKSAEWFRVQNDVFTKEQYVDPATNRIAPWLGHKPDEGEVLVQPLPSSGIFPNRQEFFDHLVTRPYQRATCEKQLLKTMPALIMPKDANVKDYVLNWLEFAIHKFVSEGLYAPPLHTLLSGKPLGVWFDYLPEGMKPIVLGEHSTVIQECIRTSKCGIMSNAELSQHFTHATNGYEMLYTLAMIGGHPRLQNTSVFLAPPRQLKDDTLQDYVLKWKNFLHKSYMMGTHYSQYFWLHTLVDNMQPFFKDIFRREFGIALVSYKTSDILPDTMLPAGILSRMIQVSQSYPKISLLGSKASDHNRTTTINSLTESEKDNNNEDVELVNALQRIAKGCIACKGEHGIFNCPNMKSVKENPREMNLLLKAVGISGSTANSFVRAMKIPANVVNEITEDDSIEEKEDPDSVQDFP